MKYRIPVTINGYIEIEAGSEEDAQAHAEDGYSITDVEVSDNELDFDQMEEIEEAH